MQKPFHQPQLGRTRHHFKPQRLLSLVLCQISVNSETRRPGLGSVDRPAKVCTSNSSEEHDGLEQEPGPAATLLRSLGAVTALGTAVRGALAGVVVVPVEGV